MALPLLTSLALASSQDSVGVSSLATASVSPPSDCLLVVAGCQDSGAGTGITMSTTLANVGAWTVVATADYATSDKTWIAYAKVTGAPGSGTVTASFSTNLVDAVVFRLFYITGHNTTTPVPQSKTNTGTAATATVTLTSTPAATSQVFAVTGQIHGTTAGSQAMVPSGTEINQDYLNNTSFNFDIEAEMQYVNGSAGTTHTVGTLGAPVAWGIVAIEIAASPPNAPAIHDRDRRGFQRVRDRWASRDRGRDQRSQFDLYHASSAVSAATTPQTLSATQTQTPTLATVSSFLRTLTATETQTPTIVKQVGHATSATQTQAPSIVKQATKTLSATQVQIPTLAAAKIIAKALSATQVQTATMVRSVGKVLSATETQTVTLIKSVGKTLSATETQTPTLAASRAFLKTLSATQTQTATIVRSVGKILSATEAQTPTVTRSVGKILTATQTQTRTLVKSVGKTLSATETQTPTLAKANVWARALTATQTQTATMARSVGKVITRTQTQTPTVTKAVTKTLTATQVQSASIVRSIGKVLSAVATQVTSLVATFHAGIPDAPLAPPLSTTFADNGARLTTGDAGIRMATTTDDGRRTTYFASNGVTYTENLNP